MSFPTGFLSKSAHLFSFHFACELSSTGHSYPKLFSFHDQVYFFSLRLPHKRTNDASFPFVSQQLQSFCPDFTDLLLLGVCQLDGLYLRSARWILKVLEEDQELEDEVVPEVEVIELETQQRLFSQMFWVLFLDLSRCSVPSNRLTLKVLDDLVELMNYDFKVVLFVGFFRFIVLKVFTFIVPI